MATLKENMEAIKLEKDTKILPENLKSGITAFGVTGTYEGTGGSSIEINNQNKTITSNGKYTADEGYTGLGEVTVNVPQDVEGAKIVDTRESMELISGEVGDMSVIYSSTIRNLTVDDVFQIVTFPETVVLPEAITDSVYAYIEQVDGGYGMCDLSLSSTSFYFHYSDESGSGYINVSYESTDGLTYTRDSFDPEGSIVKNGNTVDLGVKLKFNSEYEEFNPAFGYFFQIETKSFGGVYEYTALVEQKDITQSVNLMYAYNTSSGKYYKIPKELDLSKNFFIIVNSSHTDSSGKYDIIDTCDVYEYTSKMMVVVSSNSQLVFLATTPYTNVDPYVMYTKKVYDFTNETPLTSSTDVKNTDIIIDSNLFNYTYFTDPSYKIADLTSSSILVPNGDVLWILLYESSGNSLPMSNATGRYSDPYPITHLKMDDWYPVTYGLEAESKYVYKKSFLGKNGFEEGTLQNNSNLSLEEMNFKCEVWSSLNDMTFTGNIWEQAFANYNGTSIPPLDTSGVTNTQSCFSNAKNLKSIPLLDFSNVTDSSSMFYGCESMTSVPQINLSKSVDTSSIFSSCTNLVDIPVLDFSSTTTLLGAFTSCPNLSDESLNNILLICANATKIVNKTGSDGYYNEYKTLRHAYSYSSTQRKLGLGLSAEQREKCKTLSNYQTFVNAGWSAD